MGAPRGQERERSVGRGGMKVSGTRVELSEAFAAVPEPWRFGPIYHDLVKLIWRTWGVEVIENDPFIVTLDINDDELAPLVMAQLVANKLYPRNMP